MEQSHYNTGTIAITIFQYLHYLHFNSQMLRDLMRGIFKSLMLIFPHMSQNFQPGDFIIFQLESGFGLLRILAIDTSKNEPVWHVSAFKDIFLDAETADAAIIHSSRLNIDRPHIVLTNRAFESTQVSRLGNAPLAHNELAAYREWIVSGKGEISDRSIRLILGLR